MLLKCSWYNSKWCKERNQTHIKSIPGVLLWFVFLSFLILMGHNYIHHFHFAAFTVSVPLLSLVPQEKHLATLFSRFLTQDISACMLECPAPILFSSSLSASVSFSLEFILPAISFHSPLAHLFFFPYSRFRPQLFATDQLPLISAFLLVRSAELCLSP